MRHLFDGITQRQEEARENNITPPEFKVNFREVTLPLHFTHPSVRLSELYIGCHPLDLFIYSLGGGGGL